jgi:hypothetical protein
MAKITEVDDGRDGDATLGKARTRHEEMKELQALADEITEDARDGSGDDEDEDDDGESESEEEIVNGEFVTGPTVWEAAADEEIPENHWEYHMRKNMNDGRGDSVARNLAYVPVCNCMPVCAGEACRNPYFMWTKKK